MIDASVSAQAVESHLQVASSAGRHYLQRKLDRILGQDLSKTFGQSRNEKAMAEFDWTDVDDDDVGRIVDVVLSFEITLNAFLVVVD